MGVTISVEGLRKSYGDIRAVDGVSFEVQPGEFFGLLGPNGAGKTTTLEIVEGLRRPDAGQATIDGRSPWKREPDLLRRIGVQLQASAFFEQLTAREQLTTFADLYDVDRRRVDELLEHVGLTEHAKQRVDDLSGGQKQRLSIACAIVHEPDVVFLDEPTAALDPQARRNLWDLLRDLNESGRTVVLTTHYMEEAEELCDRVGIMDQGRLLELDSPTALVRGLDAPVRISVVAATLDTSAHSALAAHGDLETTNGDLVITTREPARILSALAELDALDGLSVRGATLEDVFLQLTGREYRA